MPRYEKNENFTGRDRLLTELFNEFRNPTPKKHHGRIALHKLGGIGKTQVAIEYVHRYKNFYKRIYWISANTQASLLSGYQKIAERIGLYSRSKLNTLHDAVATAEDVIAWLEDQENWLLVIDNLDVIEVLSITNDRNSKAILLPSTGSQPPHRHAHTLITTRNPYTVGIPAQPKEVKKFGLDDSLKLLYELSNTFASPNSPEAEAAADIVTDLGHLPLAIDQAAAYIREVAKKFTTFRTDYGMYQRELIDWKPQGVQEDYRTVAAT
jgi:NB-ARC domain